MRTTFDVVIVGAGPAGSTAAILLARAGWSVALVEKETFPRRKVCGECVAASNLALLDAVGVGPAFDAAAGPALRRVALLQRDGCVEASLPAAANPGYRWGRALGRETLDTLLVEQARSVGATVLQPWAIQALAGTPGDWVCSIRSPHSGVTAVLRARVAIDAHGSWEALPSDRPLRQSERRPGDLLAFKANFRDTSLAEGLLPILAFDGGYGGMVVADRGVTTVACCIRRDRLDACRKAAQGMRAGDAIEQFLKRQCRGVQSALDASTREGPWLASGPLKPGIRMASEDDPYRIGNAAGEAHPIIGEGMSMAMQSAALLCKHLLGDGATLPMPTRTRQREIAQCYAAEWRRCFTSRLGLAAAFAHAAMRPLGSSSLLALGRAWPGFMTLGAQLAGKTHSVANAVAIGRLARRAAPASVPQAKSVATRRR